MKIRYFANRLPFYSWLGILLIIIFWYLNWSLEGLRTHWGFFPLWLGYSLLVDGLVYTRKGSSMIKRNKLNYILLFVISAPCWWLFELLNSVLGNWHYLGKECFSDLEYFLLASLSFSTVMPSVFGTAELASTFRWLKNSDAFKGKLSIRPDRKTLLVCFSSGCITLAMLLVWPEYFFYLVWLSVYLIIEPVNFQLKNTSLFEYLSKGNWMPVISLWTGVLICAFFWEMWNLFSYPKWVYYLPIADFLHVFEMPVLGYTGYLPFSMELYALYNFTAGLAGQKQTSGFLQLLPPLKVNF